MLPEAERSTTEPSAMTPMRLYSFLWRRSQELDSALNDQ
jgi:hypothetical protein